MDEANPSSQVGTRRAAYSHLQQFYSSMQRDERLAISLVLIDATLEANDLVATDLTLQGTSTFNEKLADIQALAKQLSRKTLIELAFDILCVELRT